MRSLRSLSFLALLSVAIFSGCQKDPIVEHITAYLKPPVVNAGNSATIQMPVNTVTLSGSATTTNKGIVAYLWSVVSGPNVPSIASPGSAVTAVNSMVAGTYVFQLMAVDSAGLTGVDTASVIVKPSVQQTVTFQPGNSSTNEMTFAGNNSGLDMSGHVICLNSEAWTIGGAPLFIRGAFKFDLSTIPSTATIISAKLSLYSNPTPINGDAINANSGTANAMYIRRITNSWTAAGSTWQNQPATTTTDQVSIPHTSQSFLDVIDLDVKTLVATMHATNNYGFMMMLQNESIYNTRQFCSSYHTIADKRPKLVVVYQP